MLLGRSGGSVPGPCGDIGAPFRYDLLNPASIDRVFSVFKDGPPRWGGTTGGSIRFKILLRDDIVMLDRPCTIGSSGEGEGGSGGNSSLS